LSNLTQGLTLLGLSNIKLAADVKGHAVNS